MRDWLRYVCIIVLELAARAGIGQGKPCGLIITTFAVIFVPDLILYCLLFVFVYAGTSLLLMLIYELLLQSHYCY